MPDYNNSQIYKIVSPNHEKVYYGSTVNTLADRFSRHKSHLRCSSKEIINAGGADIKHIEWFPCDNKHALEDREAYFILNNRDGCVNMTVPGAKRRAGSKTAYRKQAYQQQTPEHRAKEKVRQQTPEYRAKVKARHQTPEYKAKQKAYLQTPEHKAREKARHQTPIQCTCGKWLQKATIKRHQRSKTCKKIIEAEVAATMNDMLDQLCVIES